jgi:hypothetical protein
MSYSGGLCFPSPFVVVIPSPCTGGASTLCERARGRLGVSVDRGSFLTVRRVASLLLLVVHFLAAVTSRRLAAVLLRIFTDVSGP